MKKYGKVVLKVQTKWKYNSATYGREKANFHTDWSAPTNQSEKAKTQTKNGQSKKEYKWILNT